MKKPATRKNRMKSAPWIETKWTKSSKSLGEYIFRRISIDQSNKDYNRIRPRHIMSKLIVQSKEIDKYVADYLSLQDSRRSNVVNSAKLESDLKNSFINTDNFPTSY